MKKNCCFPILLILSSLFISDAFSQSESRRIYKMRDSIYSYMSDHKYEAAADVGYRVAELAQSHYKRADTSYSNLLQELSKVSLKSGRYEEGLEYINRYLVLTKAIHDEKHPTYANGLYYRAFLFSKLGRYQEELADWFEVVSIWKDAYGDRDLRHSGAVSNLSIASQKMGQYSTAANLLEEVVDTYKFTVDRYDPRNRKALINLANCYLRMARYEKAEKLYKEATDIWEVTYGDSLSDSEPENRTYVSLLNSFADLYTKKGNYSSAESYYRKSLKFREQIYGKSHLKYADALDKLGMFYFAKGSYVTAEPFVKKAVEIVRESYGNKHPKYAKVLKNLSDINMAVGNKNAAHKMLKEVMLAVKNSVGNQHPDYAGVLRSLSSWYASGKKPNIVMAEAYLKKSIELGKSIFGEDHPDYADMLSELAGIHFHTEKYESAKAYYNECLKIREGIFGENHVSSAKTRFNLAKVYAATKDNERAEEFFKKSLATRLKILEKNHIDQAESYMGLAKFYWMTGKLDEARDLFIKGNEIYLAQIHEHFPLLSEKEKGLFYSTIKENFEQINSYAMQHRKSQPSVLEEVYNFQLSTKALLFHSTSNVRKQILEGGDSVLVRQYRELEGLRDELATYHKMTPDQLKRLDIDLEEKESKANELEKKVTFKATKRNEAKTYSWQQVRDKLGPKEAALEIIRFREYLPDNGGEYTGRILYAALIVSKKTKDHPAVVLLEKGKKMEDLYLKYYQNSIQEYLEDESSYKVYWQEIYEHEAMAGVEKIYVSPDGVYNQVNLNTLLNPDTYDYVLDEVDICVVTNTRELIDEQKLISIDSCSPAALIGYPLYDLTKKELEEINPEEEISFEGKTRSMGGDDEEQGIRGFGGDIAMLPGTLTEVNEIAKVFEDLDRDVVVYTGSEATEDVIKSLKNPLILHIATHGYFDRSDNKNTNAMMQSGVLLAGAANSIKRMNSGNNSEEGTKEDGIMTAYEAMNLSLNGTRLVLLSACETGLGVVEQGEGVYGLQRAFQTAGASTIVMSLWKVNDETTQKLMTRFMESFLSGEEGKREAFRSAQMKIREEFDEPYYWGAFNMIGN